MAAKLATTQTQPTNYPIRKIIDALTANGIELVELEYLPQQIDGEVYLKITVVAPKAEE